MLKNAKVEKNTIFKFLEVKCIIHEIKFLFLII